ncbi:ankyrin repeat and SOCS box protein 14 isoform X4 [Sceloporus undulatus]|uniref:ankyrin repeat and SOCS box protein 14 isoform X4 n=1 Tax=Sceloporus undulatus TaxID=8520 RepID=UPI001C4B058C|nr:ankyrin repeat and SOCS box protein 14 isoform X4 [Sceloporus undulatus]
MYDITNTNDDVDDDIPTQYVIQQSLQDIHKSKTVNTEKNDSFSFATSENHKKIIAAIRTGEEAALLKLMRNGSAFQETDGEGCLPLHEAASQPNKNILEITLKASHCIVWQQTNLKGETPLFLAVDKCLAKNVHFLLLNGFNPDVRNEEGDSALIVAIKHNSYEIASLLIQFGADVNLQCINKRTALHEAARLGLKDIVELLLCSKADPDPRSSYGLTPLALAAQNGHTEILEILLHKAGVNVLSQASDCASILFEAAGGGNPDCVSLLLEYGADANVPKHSGHLPIHRAAYRGHFLALQILVPVTHYSAIKESGISPVHSAAAALQYTLKDEVMLRMLLNYGYNVHRCFDCPHGNNVHAQYIFEGWTSTVIKDTMFCEVITLSWLRHLSGKVVRVMLDYVDHIQICAKLQDVLQEQELWPEIHAILTNARSLKHLCRLRIRKCLGRLRLRCPVFLTFLPLPNRLKEYILYKEYDLYGQGNLEGIY